MAACPDARVAVSEDQGEAEGPCFCHQRRVRIRIAEGEARLGQHGWCDTEAIGFLPQAVGLSRGQCKRSQSG